jgi:hypothetical protein
MREAEEHSHWIRCQVTTSEDVAYREGLMCAVRRSLLSELTKALRQRVIFGVETEPVDSQ